MRRSQREQCIIPLLFLICASLLLYTMLLLELSVAHDLKLWETLVTKGSVMVFLANFFIALDLALPLFKPRSRLTCALRRWPSQTAAIFLLLALSLLVVYAWWGAGTYNRILLLSVLVVLQLITPLLYVIFWFTLMPHRGNMAIRIIFWMLFSLVYLGVSWMDGQYWGPDQLNLMMQKTTSPVGSLLISWSGFSFWIALAFILQFSGEWLLFHLPKKRK